MNRKLILTGIIAGCILGSAAIGVAKTSNFPGVNGTDASAYLTNGATVSERNVATYKTSNMPGVNGTDASAYLANGSSVSERNLATYKTSNSSEWARGWDASDYLGTRSTAAGDAAVASTADASTYTDASQTAAVDKSTPTRCYRYDSRDPKNSRILPGGRVIEPTPDK